MTRLAALACHTVHSPVSRVMWISCILINLVFINSRKQRSPSILPTGGVGQTAPCFSLAGRPAGEEAVQCRSKVTKAWRNVVDRSMTATACSSCLLVVGMNRTDGCGIESSVGIFQRVTGLYVSACSRGREAVTVFVCMRTQEADDCHRELSSAQSQEL